MPSLGLDLELVDVAYAYTSSVPLLSRVSFRLSAGWTGVIGANGAGKTTLLRLITGELEPDAGIVRRAPSLRFAVCPQRVARRDETLERFAVATTREAARMRGRLRLQVDDLVRWEQLSPGERRRWQIGAALHTEPSLLLLDEPTNHLDAQARELLTEALRRFRGIGMLVSHDRTLLASLTRWTVRLHRGTARLYGASYEQAREGWTSAEHNERDRAASLRREQKQLTQRLSDRRTRWAHADARTRTSKRMKGPRDSASRAAFKASRRRSAVTALGHEIRKLHGQIERVEVKAAGYHFEKERGRSIFVDYQPASTPQLAHFEAEALTVGERPRRRTLLRNVRADLGRSDRIWLSGPNGSGKTTLLRQLAQAARVPAERILLVPQELEEQAGLAQLERVRGLPSDERGRLLQRVAALGIDPVALLASERPSPGEARKLMLAEALGRQVWALILDEPTHHLDLPSLERLEEALYDYPGALLLVTHDDAFARRLARTRWCLEDGELRVSALP